ncbi:hypothetical protein [Pygmaiobacter massiliensis]|uniref:hypothetical protein n=1 Tax=Pygmaiobacter massiliensis TaxID=1917873 RepID=UPI002A83F17D|nr:hypothetical protein [Pygmaiobacter massiliensis]MDY4785492.1 hypothetical protein [Pygmaiobacter massiliensis]
MDSITISVLIALVGCFVGLAGWLSKRDGKIAGDAEWRGGVNAKLDVIVGIKSDVAQLSTTVQGHGERLTAVEASAKQAHLRLDRIEGSERR